jgi:hypothetical protein
MPAWLGIKGFMLGIKSTTDVKPLQVGFLDLATNEFRSSARSEVPLFGA